MFIFIRLGDYSTSTGILLLPIQGAILLYLLMKSCNDSLFANLHPRISIVGTIQGYCDQVGILLTLFNVVI